MPRTNSALELRPSFLTAGSRWLLFLLVLSAAMGPVQAALQRQATLTATVPNTYNFKYLLYLPPGYDPNGTTQWPLMIFLHGAGERGTNPDVVAVNGPPMLIEKGRDFPAIVISPQCSDSWWDYTALELFIEDRVRQYRVDPDRVYVTGLSMGGYAVWDLAVNHPGNYAAAAPL